jgi:hypothetical protein
VSFIKKAQEAAVQAAEVARARAQEAAAVANRAAADPATTETLARSARDAVGMARRGVTTVIEKIDPSTLADLIIKATALQEMTNTALRDKRSPYRISEVDITASIPPGVTFAIGRLEPGDEAMGGSVVSSEQLVTAQAASGGEAVISLDGTTLSEEQLSEVRRAFAADVPEEIDQL